MRNLQKGNEESTAILADLVSMLSYKPGWTFDLAEVSRGQGCEGLTLRIAGTVPDSWNPAETTSFLHLMPVLPAAYDRESWMHWLFEQISLVERHECMEFFEIDGEKPYFPSHAPGHAPYFLRRNIDRADALADALPYHGGPPRDFHFSA